LRDARKPQFDCCAARGAAACRGGRPRPLQLCSMSPSACEERAMGPGLEVWWLSGGPVRGQDYRRGAGQVEPPSKVERTQTSQGRRTSATTDLEQSLMVSVPRCGLRPGWPALVAAGQGWVGRQPLVPTLDASAGPHCAALWRRGAPNAARRHCTVCAAVCAAVCWLRCVCRASRAGGAGAQGPGRRPLGVATSQPAVPLRRASPSTAHGPPQCALVVQHCCACYV
jgi:hypothetical protein